MARTGASLTVKRKLWLATGGAIAVFLIIGGVSFWAMSSLSAAHDRVSKGVMPKVLAADTRARPRPTCTSHRPATCSTWAPGAATSSGTAPSTRRHWTS